MYSNKCSEIGKHCRELYADLSGQGARLELVDVLIALLVAGPHQVRLQPQQGRRGRHVADANGESSGIIYSFMFKPDDFALVSSYRS
jgi:hypothetical protein